MSRAPIARRRRNSCLRAKAVASVQRNGLLHPRLRSARSQRPGRRPSSMLLTAYCWNWCLWPVRRPRQFSIAAALPSATNSDLIAWLQSRRSLLLRPERSCARQCVPPDTPGSHRGRFCPSIRTGAHGWRVSRWLRLGCAMPTAFTRLQKTCVMWIRLRLHGRSASEAPGIASWRCVLCGLLPRQ